MTIAKGFEANKTTEEYLKEFNEKLFPVMTPKEKALQLMRQFNNLDTRQQYNHDARKCALIVVNEICTVFYPVKYWEQVKSELEKL